MAYVVHNIRAKREPISVSIYGYARVSTDGQTLDAQVAQLKAAGAEKIFREKISGARSAPPELARLMRPLSAGPPSGLCDWVRQPPRPAGALHPRSPTI